MGSDMTSRAWSSSDISVYLIIRFIRIYPDIRIHWDICTSAFPQYAVLFGYALINVHKPKRICAYEKTAWPILVWIARSLLLTSHLLPHSPHMYNEPMTHCAHTHRGCCEDVSGICMYYMYHLYICILRRCLRCSGVTPTPPSLSPRIDSPRCREAPSRKSNTGCTMHVTDKTDAASGAHIEAKLSPPSLLVWWILGLLCDSPQLRRAECIVLPPLLKGKRQCPALFCRGGRFKWV